MSYFYVSASFQPDFVYVLYPVPISCFFLSFSLKEELTLVTLLTCCFHDSNTGTVHAQWMESGGGEKVN